jgi:hypothetical protein
MQVVTRYRVDAGEASSFLRSAQSVLTVLGNCTSWRPGDLGHVVDDPTRWVRTGEGDDVGCHWRTLAAPEVEMSVMPLLDGPLDEPTVFELLSHLGGTGSAMAGDADHVRVGGGSAPVIATGFERR